MKIKQFGDELTIKENPSLLWIFGLIAAAIGVCFIYLALGGGSKPNQPAPWVLVPAFIIGSMAVVSGFLLILNSPVTKIVINRYTKIVTLTRFGLSGKKETTYNFEALKRFCAIEETDDEGCPIWSLGIEFTDGEMIKISSLPSNDEKVKLNFVFQANQFMYKEMPSFQDSYQLKDET